ncbi:MAG: hypothetical protein LBP65_02180 [Puniceicoccales bacterium]|nr:hypothetical protein [Puniceicoccales bacterium]
MAGEGASRPLKLRPKENLLPGAVPFRHLAKTFFLQKKLTSAVCHFFTLMIMETKSMVSPLDQNSAVSKLEGNVKKDKAMIQIGLILTVFTVPVCIAAAIVSAILQSFCPLYVVFVCCALLLGSLVVLTASFVKYVCDNKKLSEARENEQPEPDKKPEDPEPKNLKSESEEDNRPDSGNKSNEELDSLNKKSEIKPEEENLGLKKKEEFKKNEGESEINPEDKQLELSNEPKDSSSGRSGSDIKEKDKSGIPEDKQPALTTSPIDPQFIDGGALSKSSATTESEEKGPSIEKNKPKSDAPCYPVAFIPMNDVQNHIRGLYFNQTSTAMHESVQTKPKEERKGEGIINDLLNNLVEAFADLPEQTSGSDFSYSRSTIGEVQNALKNCISSVVKDSVPVSGPSGTTGKKPSNEALRKFLTKKSFGSFFKKYSIVQIALLHLKGAGVQNMLQLLTIAVEQNILSQDDLSKILKEAGDSDGLFQCLLGHVCSSGSPELTMDALKLLNTIIKKFSNEKVKKNAFLRNYIGGVSLLGALFRVCAGRTMNSNMHGSMVTEALKLLKVMDVKEILNTSGMAMGNVGYSHFISMGLGANENPDIWLALRDMVLVPKSEGKSSDGANEAPSTEAQDNVVSNEQNFTLSSNMFSAVLEKSGEPSLCALGVLLLYGDDATYRAVAGAINGLPMKEKEKALVTIEECCQKMAEYNGVQLSSGGGNRRPEFLAGRSSIDQKARNRANFLVKTVFNVKKSGLLGGRQEDDFKAIELTTDPKEMVLPEPTTGSVPMSVKVNPNSSRNPFKSVKGGVSGVGASNLEFKSGTPSATIAKAKDANVWKDTEGPTTGSDQVNSNLPK